MGQDLVTMIWKMLNLPEPIPDTFFVAGNSIVWFVGDHKQMSIAVSKEMVDKIQNLQKEDHNEKE